jgi:hypothetical protein
MDYNYIIFYTLLVLLYVCYFALFFQLIKQNVYEKYKETIKTFTQFYIGIYLFIHFRPFHKTKLTDFDKTVIFNSAILLLTTSILFNTYMPKLLNYFHINLY